MALPQGLVWLFLRHPTRRYRTTQVQRVPLLSLLMTLSRLSPPMSLQGKVLNPLETDYGPLRLLVKRTSCSQIKLDDSTERSVIYCVRYRSPL